MSPDSGPDPLVWTVTDLGPGEHLDLTFQVDVDGPAPDPYCFFVMNTATIELDGVQLTRKASTTVGDECSSVFLPLAKRQSQ